MLSNISPPRLESVISKYVYFVIYFDVLRCCIRLKSLCYLGVILMGVVLKLNTDLFVLKELPRVSGGS